MKTRISDYDFLTTCKQKLSHFTDVLLLPYEDELLSFWMKLVFLFFWVVSILNGLLFKTDLSYIIAQLFLIGGLSLNLILCKKSRQRWINVFTFFLLCIPNCFIFYNASIGSFSMLYLIVYGSGVVFILGIRDSLPINIGFLALSLYYFRMNTDSQVFARYGENNALRFPYLFVCIILIIYCLMYMIQDTWLQKRRRTQILEQRIYDEHQKLNSMSLKIMNSMVHALDAKIPGKEEHCHRIAEFAKEIATQKGLAPNICLDAYNAGLLHEIGMIGIPDSLIQKTEFTEEEYSTFKTYAEKGYEIIRTLQSSDSQSVSEAVLYHRENYNGTGFPSGLSGDNIPPLARILAVADFTDRHLRRSESTEHITELLLTRKNVDFEPESTDIMIQILKKRLSL